MRIQMSVVGVTVAVKSFWGPRLSGTSKTLVSTPRLDKTTRGFSHSGPIRTRICEGAGPPSGVCAEAAAHSDNVARQKSAARIRAMENCAGNAGYWDGLAFLLDCAVCAPMNAVPAATAIRTAVATPLLIPPGPPAAAAPPAAFSRPAFA